MGDPTLDPARGNDCLDCFAAGYTPKYVYCTITGVEVCEFAPPGVVGISAENWLLIQDPGFPCTWSNAPDPHWAVSYNACAGGKSQVIASYDGFSIFNGIERDCCKTGYVNGNHCAVPQPRAYGGQAQVAWIPLPGSPSVQKLMAKLAMEPNINTVFEHWPVEDFLAVFKLARILDSTRVHVKIDPDAL